MPSPPGTVLQLQFVPEHLQTQGKRPPPNPRWPIEKTQPRPETTAKLKPVSESLLAGLRSLIARHEGQPRRGGDIEGSKRLFLKGGPMTATVAKTTVTFNRFAVIDQADALCFPSLVIRKGCDNGPGSFRHVRVRLLNVTIFRLATFAICVHLTHARTQAYTYAAICR